MEQEQEQRCGAGALEQNRRYAPYLPLRGVPPTAEELTGRTQSGLGVRRVLVASRELFGRTARRPESSQAGVPAA